MLVDSPYEVLNQVPLTCYPGPGGSKLFLVHTKAEWNVFFDLLMKQPLVFADTETSGFSWFADDRIVGLSFGWGPDRNFYIPVRHVNSLTGGVQPEQLNIEDIKADLEKFFKQADLTLVFHNAKFDLHFLKKEGFVIAAKIRDTRIQWALKDENAPGALKTVSSGWRDIMGQWHNGLVEKSANQLEKEVDEWRAEEAKARRKHFNHLLMDAADQAQTEIEFQGMKRVEVKKYIVENVLHNHPYREAKKEDVHYGVVPITLMAKYAALDVYLTWVLYWDTEKYISERPKLASLYENEMELSEALLTSESHGMVIRREVLEQLGVTFQEQKARLEQEIKAVLGDINLNSNRQIVDALLKLGIELEKTTDASTEDDPQFAIDREVLNDLATDHDIAKKLLELRELLKLKGTYVDSILDKLQKRGNDWVIYPTFNQNVSTGRMGCSNPSVQQIPGRTKNGKLIRSAFGVPEEHVLLLADYCLAAGTLVDTPVGHVAIEDLKVGDIVYTYNRDTAKPDASKVSNVKFTGLLETLKVTLDNGKEVRCTPNHKWLLHSGEEILAKDLEVGTRLLPLRKSYASKKKYQTLYSRSSHAYVYAHKAVAAAKVGVDVCNLYDVVHHVDENCLNNDPSNLEILSAVDHKALHGREHATAQWADPIVRERMCLGISQAVKDRGGHGGANNPNFNNRRGPTLSCIGCNKSFYVPPSNSGKKYCSKECYFASRRGEADLNHKVVKIEHDGLVVPTFDIQVARDHNFALAAGVFVHNSQIELRLTAHFSQDPLFLDAYAKDQDIHTRTMCEMFDFSYEEVYPVIKEERKEHPKYELWKSLRTAAKIINFGLIYGVGPDGLSKQIPRPAEYVWTRDSGCTKEEMTARWIAQCKSYIDQYMYKYIGVKRFINQTSRHVLRTGEVEDMFGRIRHLPWYNASRTLGQEYRWMEGRAARQGTNYVVQGSAADMFKTAAVRVHKLFKGHKSKLVAYIHDELFMYLHKDELFLLPAIKEAMEDFPEFSVPIVAEMAWSPTDWASKMGLK